MQGSKAMNINAKLEKIRKTNPEKARRIEIWLNSFFYYVDKEDSHYEERIPNIHRGKILYVDFGYNVQSEFRYNHYCVALHDSPRKSHKVTVVPITSKQHPGLLPIYNELGNALETAIKEQEKSLFWKPYRKVVSEVYARKNISLFSPVIGSYSTVYPNCSQFIHYIKTPFDTEDPFQEYLNNMLVSLEIFKVFIEESPKLLESSYLRVEDITTISKARIIQPKRNTHPLYYLKLSDETLNKLDNELIRLFTKARKG